MLLLLLMLTTVDAVAVVNADVVVNADATFHAVVGFNDADSFNVDASALFIPMVVSLRMQLIQLYYFHFERSHYFPFARFAVSWVV